MEFSSGLLVTVPIVLTNNVRSDKLPSTDCVSIRTVTRSSRTYKIISITGKICEKIRNIYEGNDEDEDEDDGEGEDGDGDGEKADPANVNPERLKAFNVRSLVVHVK